jgi:hypothetical protein
MLEGVGLKSALKPIGEYVGLLGVAEDLYEQQVRFSLIS